MPISAQIEHFDEEGLKELFEQALEKVIIKIKDYFIINQNFTRVLFNPEKIFLRFFKTRSTRTTEAQLSKIKNKIPPSTDNGHFPSWNLQKWISYQIRGGKT